MSEAAHQLLLWGPNQQFLIELSSAKVRFLVIGGVAVHFYVPSRQIGDLDVLIDRSEQNAEKVTTALIALGLSPNFSLADLSKPKIQLPIKTHYDVDILTGDDQFDFDKAMARSSKASVIDQSGFATVNVAAAETLLEMLHAVADPNSKRAEDILLLQAAVKGRS
jgi:hypothetical protein